jgi:hypothetical protein
MCISTIEEHEMVESRPREIHNIEEVIKLKNKIRDMEQEISMISEKQ